MPPGLPPSLALPPGLSEAMLAELTELFAHLAPRDVFERLLVTRVVQAAARILLSAEREPLEPNALWLRHEVAADRLFRQSLAALERHRRDQPVGAAHAATAADSLLPAGGPGRAGEVRSASATGLTHPSPPGSGSGREGAAAGATPTSSWACLPAGPGRPANLDSHRPTRSTEGVPPAISVRVRQVPWLPASCT